MEVKTDFGMYKGAFLRVGRYWADKSPAIEIENRTDGPIARITVCLTDFSLDKGEAYVDTNNCPWALDFIRQYGLGVETGRMRPSGYCIYPAVLFDMKKLEEFSEE